MKIKINSDDDLALEKTLNLHNIVICIKFAFNINCNHYYFQVALEKCSNRLAEMISNLEYCRIDMSEDNDINKTTDSHECKVSHYWYYFKINFGF